MSAKPAEALTTAEVASLAGVHRDTLLRWLRQGLIPEPHRDRHGWRTFTQTQAEQITRFSETGASATRESDESSGVPFTALESVDWNFTDAKTTYLTHGLHPYPAKFIPQIPNALIQELSSVGETVADIFCGSGTTLVEALTLKRHAVGVDANPLACLISQGKTTRLEEGDEERLRHLVTDAEILSERIALQTEDRLLFPLETFSSKAPRPTEPAISFWFEPHVVEELAEILSWCNAIATVSARTLALAALSSIIVAVSKQDSDTRYVRREKGIQPGDATRRFARSLADAVKAAAEFTALVEPRFACDIHHSNILEPPDIGVCDLVVCSPPYPNAYSYHLYHMTRMLWLGMDQPRFKQVEIGSHRKYSRKGPSGANIDTFASEMSRTFQWLRGHLRTGRFACFVIGDSTINGRKFDNASLLSNVARRAGFLEVRRFERSLQTSRKAFNPSYAKTKSEHILVLKKA